MKGVPSQSPKQPRGSDLCSEIQIDSRNNGCLDVDVVISPPVRSPDDYHSMPERFIALTYLEQDVVVHLIIQQVVEMVDSNEALPIIN